MEQNFSPKSTAVKFCTDLGSLIGVLTMDILQCRNLAIFLPLLFYVKSILAAFRRSIIAVFTILKTEFPVLKEFHTWKRQKILNPKLLKWSKRQFWGFKMTNVNFTLNLSGRKFLKFPHCVFPIRIPRSVNNFHTVYNNLTNFHTVLHFHSVEIQDFFII